MVSTRAGMCGGVGVVHATSSMWPAVHPSTTSPCNRDEIATYGWCGTHWHRISGRRGEKHGSNKAS